MAKDPTYDAVLIGRILSPHRVRESNQGGRLRRRLGGAADRPG